MATDQTDERTVPIPHADRPHLPELYGVPTTLDGTLPWSRAEGRLASARNYWVGTTLPDGTPHAVPVWGVWLDGRLFFGMDPGTRTMRNLERNPTVVVHLESGNDVVILKGRAELATDRALLRRAAALGAAKYGAPQPPDDPTDEADNTGQPVYAVRPHTAYAWTDLTRDATRWRFPPD